MPHVLRVIQLNCASITTVSNCIKPTHAFILQFCKHTGHLTQGRVKEKIFQIDFRCKIEISEASVLELWPCAQIKIKAFWMGLNSPCPLIPSRINISFLSHFSDSCTHTPEQIVPCQQQQWHVVSCKRGVMWHVQEGLSICLGFIVSCFRSADTILKNKIKIKSECEIQIL